MKKNNLKVMAAALILSTTTLAVQSCSNDDDPIITSPAGSFEPGNFKGEITSGNVVTLDPSKVYKLTGAVSVKKAACLSFLPEQELRPQAEHQPILQWNRADKSLPTVLPLLL